MKSLTTFLQATGSATLNMLAATGRVTLFILDTLRQAFSGPFYLREFGHALIQIGWLSLPVVGDRYGARIGPCAGRFDGCGTCGQFNRRGTWHNESNRADRRVGDPVNKSDEISYPAPRACRNIGSASFGGRW